MKKAVLLLIILVSSFLNAQDETQIFTTQLYNQAAMLFKNAGPQCRDLKQKNKALTDAVSELHKKAREKQNVATNVFANAEYLLKFLQERIEETCGLAEIVNDESIRIIISQEFRQLAEKHSQAANLEEFIDRIYGTEYAKLLYLATSVSTLEKMYEKWAAKMVSDRKDAKKTVSNIAEANVELKKELTDFTKTFKFYYKK